MNSESFLLHAYICFSSDRPFRGERQNCRLHHPKPEARRWSYRLRLTSLPHPHLVGSTSFLDFQALLSVPCHDRWSLGTRITIPIITVHLDHCQAAALPYHTASSPPSLQLSDFSDASWNMSLAFLLTKILQWTLVVLRMKSELLKMEHQVFCVLGPSFQAPPLQPHYPVAPSPHPPRLCSAAPPQ